MKRNDIESYLRDNKPQVKKNPTFLLEVQQKMQAVEGIKNEVDRQRKFGSQSLILALIAGMICGIALTVFAYLYPVDPEAISENITTSLRIVIDPWKEYLILLIAGCAIGLGIILSKQQSDSTSFSD